MGLYLKIEKKWKMTSTNKGNYLFCSACKYYISKPFDASSVKYPCYYSHKAVRGDVKCERDFKVCLLKETKWRTAYVSKMSMDSLTTALITIL